MSQQRRKDYFHILCLIHKRQKKSSDIFHYCLLAFIKGYMHSVCVIISMKAAVTTWEMVVLWTPHKPRRAFQRLSHRSRSTGRRNQASRLGNPSPLTLGEDKTNLCLLCVLWETCLSPLRTSREIHPLPPCLLLLERIPPRPPKAPPTIQASRSPPCIHEGAHLVSTVIYGEQKPLIVLSVV